LTNSLRLELAMRIVKVNPALAESQAEKAMATGNLITNNSQNAAYVPAGQVEGALSTLNYTWGVGNTTPGADVASFLVGYNDPRLPIFLAPTNSSNTPSRVPIGGYCTQRLGSVQVPGDVTLAATMFSLPGTGIPQSGSWCANNPASSTFFNAAETNFLLAEASLRQWNMGTYTNGAQAYYTTGVTASMNQWGVPVGNYLTTTATPANFVDPTLPARDINAVSTCSPQWTDASTNEGHLEQIITQKWIALWPVNSPVAWAEYRRTGYPKLFPGYFTAVAPTISWGGLTVDNARKILLPTSEYLNNTGNVYNAINAYLGGTDAITTHVWWDVNSSNF
jgi:Susd and RagB outer membrane lipoprotein